MTLDPQKLRIEGTYQQKQPGYYMQRVKVPGGLLSAEQARKVAEIAERFAGGGLHLTTRASIELHWIRENALVEVARMLTAVGLTSRGACGGAVRGIVCSTPFLGGFPAVQVLARKLHHHFTQNPHFEGLPKKFKIGVDAGYQDSRHLIQDVGLVLSGRTEEWDCYDVWVAGGLGREPQPALLLEEGVPEDRIITLIEAVITIYRQHTPQGKRLKHLVREKGEEEFRNLLRQELSGKPSLTLPDGFPKQVTETGPAPAGAHVVVPIFAGELSADSLRRLADIAAACADGFMVLTCRQNVAFNVTDEAAAAEAGLRLAEAGLGGESAGERVDFVICPGNHECRMGLAPTRDVAGKLVQAMTPEGKGLSWAISGCANSCSQPQLADVGIVVSKLLVEADGDRHPRFDLYRRSADAPFGGKTHQGVSLDELISAVAELR